MKNYKNVLENIDFTAMSLPERTILIRAFKNIQGDTVIINKTDCLKELAQGSPPHSDATKLNLFGTHALRAIYCRGESDGAVYVNLFRGVEVCGESIIVTASDSEMLRQYVDEAENLFKGSEMDEFISLNSKMGRILYTRAKQSRGKPFSIDVKEMSQVLNLAGKGAAALIQHHVLPAIVDLRPFFDDFWFTKQYLPNGAELIFNAKERSPEGLRKN